MTQRQLHYQAAGTGEQTFVLIHNAGGNHRFLAPQHDYLQRHGRVISVDLAGHASIPAHAQDLIALCAQLGVTQACFVGLNYGGNVAVEIAYQQPGLVSRLVVMDPPFLLEPWGIKLIEDHIEELADPLDPQFAENLVAHVLKNTAHKAMAVQSFQQAPPATLRDTYRNLLRWDADSPTRLAACKMPILNIQSDQPFCQETIFRRHCPHLVTTTIPGTGHWLTLDASDTINQLLP